MPVNNHLDQRNFDLQLGKEKTTGKIKTLEHILLNFLDMNQSGETSQTKLILQDDMGSLW